MLIIIAIAIETVVGKSEKGQITECFEIMSKATGGIIAPF